MKLKFRVWNKHKKEMVCLSTIFNKTITIPIVISQYTGAKDKRGKDIYEGDILYSCVELINVQSGQPTGKMRKTISIVKWLNNKCCFSYDNMFPMSLNIVSKYKKIIGNIYENPKLITSFNADLNYN